MRRLSFGAERARELRHHGSRAVGLVPLCRLAGAGQAVCLHVDAGGVVGGHPAGVAQLFAVVAGRGWVRGEEGPRRPLVAGEAVLFAAGEWHESGSDAEEGMVAIVIEGEQLEAAAGGAAEEVG
jgi:quercetin dioxygenase-like cupin family protein